MDMEQLGRDLGEVVRFMAEELGEGDEGTVHVSVIQECLQDGEICPEGLPEAIEAHGGLWSVIQACPEEATFVAHQGDEVTDRDRSKGVFHVRDRITPKWWNEAQSLVADMARQMTTGAGQKSIICQDLEAKLYGEYPALRAKVEGLGGLPHVVRSTRGLGFTERSRAGRLEKVQWIEVVPEEDFAPARENKAGGGHALQEAAREEPAAAAARGPQDDYMWTPNGVMTEQHVARMTAQQSIPVLALLVDCAAKMCSNRGFVESSKLASEFYRMDPKHKEHIRAYFGGTLKEAVMLLPDYLRWHDQTTALSCKVQILKGVEAEDYLQPATLVVARCVQDECKGKLGHAVSVSRVEQRLLSAKPWMMQRLSDLGGIREVAQWIPRYLCLCNNQTQLLLVAALDGGGGGSSAQQEGGGASGLAGTAEGAGEGDLVAATKQHSQAIVAVVKRLCQDSHGGAVSAAHVSEALRRQHPELGWEGINIVTVAEGAGSEIAVVQEKGKNGLKKGATMKYKGSMEAAQRSGTGQSDKHEQGHAAAQDWDALLAPDHAKQRIAKWKRTDASNRVCPSSEALAEGLADVVGVVVERNKLLFVEGLSSVASCYVPPECGWTKSNLNPGSAVRVLAHLTVSPRTRKEWFVEALELIDCKAAAAVSDEDQKRGREKDAVDHDAARRVKTRFLEFPLQQFADTKGLAALLDRNVLKTGIPGMKKPKYTGFECLWEGELKCTTEGVDVACNVQLRALWTGSPGADDSECIVRGRRKGLVLEKTLDAQLFQKMVRGADKVLTPEGGVLLCLLMEQEDDGEPSAAERLKRVFESLDGQPGCVGYIEISKTVHAVVLTPGSELHEKFVPGCPLAAMFIWN